MASWQHHPFAVEAVLARTTVLTYAAPAAALQPLLPPCLTLDTLAGQGFVAVAMVQTRQLRPRGLPAWLGQDFFLIGYRLLVRYHSAAGKRLRGLYILRSETDQPRMTWLGNRLTSYGYHTIDLAQHATGPRQRICSTAAALDVTTLATDPPPPLPPGSPFTDWAQARRYAGPLPFTFSYDPADRHVTIVEGRRAGWTPRPVHVEAAQVGFLARLPPVRLASAFVTHDVPYHWQRGRRELWTG